MHKKLNIAERLNRSYKVICIVMGITALIGLVAMIAMSSAYSNAMVNYGFSQGDIGKAMVKFADTRSATRAAIGYYEPTAIENAKVIREERKAEFEEHFAKVKGTLTSDEEEAIYANIVSGLETYWECDALVVERGATPNASKSKQAQMIATEQLDPQYELIYSELSKLLELNVHHGNLLSRILTVVSVVLAIVLIIVMVISTMASLKLGKKIAQGIVAPMNALIERFRTFATGDLSSPFPDAETGDEVAEMVKEASEMATTLSIIINDAGEILGEMASGNYAVRSDAGEKYTGDFEKLLNSMNTMRDRMRVTLKSIAEASTQVSAGAENLSEASQNLAEGATEQAGAVEELQATITTITENIQILAQSATDAYGEAKMYAEESDKSRYEMETMVRAMERIDETSKKIGNIISEIEDIA